MGRSASSLCREHLCEITFLPRDVQSVWSGEGLKTFFMTEPLVVKMKNLFQIQKSNASKYQRMGKRHLCLLLQKQTLDVLGLEPAQ